MDHEYCLLGRGLLQSQWARRLVAPWRKRGSGDGYSVGQVSSIRSRLIITYPDLNLPINGLAAALVVLFLRLRTPRGSFFEKIKRMDWM